MFDSPQLIRRQIEERMQLRFERLPMQPGLAKQLAAQLGESAVSIVPWSQRQLITLGERSGFTQLHLSGVEVPSVVYYKPIAAASLVISALTGILGAANGLLVGLAVISGILTIEGVRTAVSLAESLLFWVVYSAEGHCIPREGAKARFEAESRPIPDLGPDDFEPALHALVRLGCLRIVGGAIEVADKVIVH